MAQDLAKTSGDDIGSGAIDDRKRPASLGFLVPPTEVPKSLEALWSGATADGSTYTFTVVVR
jgi:hypothetical protein